MFWTKILYFWSIVQGLEQSKGKKACFGTHSLMITAYMQTTKNNYSWLATTQNGHIFRDTPQQYKHDNTFIMQKRYHSFEFFFKPFKNLTFIWLRNRLFNSSNPMPSHWHTMSALSVSWKSPFKVHWESPENSLDFITLNIFKIEHKAMQKNKQMLLCKKPVGT